MTYSKVGTLATALIILSASLEAALVDSSWTLVAGANASLSGGSAGTVTMTAATTNIDAAVFTGFDVSGSSLVLSNTGDSITLSGSIFISGTLSGVNSHPGTLRIGLYDSNGSSDNTGWLGYTALLDTAGTAGTSGGIFRRSASNSTTFYGAGAGATRLTTYDSAEAAFITGTTYNFSLTLTKVINGIQINSIATNSVNSSQIFLNSSVLDTSANTASFNKFGFYTSSSGGGLGAESITLSNIDVTKTAVPECETWCLGSGVLIISTLIARRRRIKRQIR